MRWLNGSPERKIEAFIGAWGVKTGDIVDTDHLLELASRLFEVDNNGMPARMMAAIDRIGPKGRKALAKKNLAAVMGNAGRFDPAWGSGAAVQSNPSIERPTLSMIDRMMEASSPQLIDGDDFECEGQLDIDPARLLGKVVGAVIAADRADILWEFPEVLAYFGAKIPQREDVAGLHNVDQRMFEAADKWPNRQN